MRTAPTVTGLALLSAFAFAACSSSGGGGSGTGGTGPGAGGNSGAAGTDATGRGGASAGTGGGSLAGTGGAPTGIAGTTGAAGQAGSTGAAGQAGTTGTGGVAGQGGSAGATGSAGTFGVSGPTRCDTTLPLCESFESGSIDAALWTTTKAGDATIVVDGVHAARGTKALHIKTVTGGSANRAWIKETKTFPATNNVLYGRMFVWFEDALTTDGHFTLAEGAGTGTAGLIRFGGQFKAFGVGTDGGSSGDWTDSDRSKLIPTQTWICAEFQFDGPTHTFHVWWDDMARPTLTSGPSKHTSFTMPTFNGLWFGWWMYNLAEPQELWIDEIAVDYKPIGCTK